MGADPLEGTRHDVKQGACSDVEHHSCAGWHCLWDLLFETDLPEYETFQEAQYKPQFRTWQRCDLRMKARFSETLRKYGALGVPCAADVWEAAESAMARTLLDDLKRDGETQRASIRAQGQPDKYLWSSEGEPDFKEELRRACERVAGRDKVLELQHCRVADRLRQPLHESAVREALGCLIPPELDPNLDGKKTKATPRQAVPAPKLYLHAESWRVNMLEE